jgi:hypothetical protein
MLIIDVFQLKKYRRRLPILVCLFMLLCIERVYTTHHSIKLTDHGEPQWVVHIFGPWVPKVRP